MKSRETIAVYAKNDTKTINGLREQSATYKNVNTYNLKQILIKKVSYLPFHLILV